MLKEWVFGEGRIVVTNNKRFKTITLERATKQFPIGTVEINPGDVNEAEEPVHFRFTSIEGLNVLREALDTIHSRMVYESCYGAEEVSSKLDTADNLIELKKV